ncbi:hypothetical protein GI374_00055 [Paracoccus sp. S-4012]|uniref:hypothetical protein n=1 Tax=Paracoccus sp. S-4012 TaxID=2665648 RepID=UPI00132A098E|nr:hypothetical protein [Paracoccus sp. S-4012]MRX48854.1 hypothetical protein [Paracoccus sp. S-4012]
MPALPSSAADFQFFPGNVEIPAVIHIKGEVVPGDSEKFYDLVEHEDRAIVTLDSPGGMVQDGLSIASEIAMRGYTTTVAGGDECYSVCAVMWVSGKNRVMDRTSSIGVHAAWRDIAMDDGTSLATESGVANADIGSFLTHVGLSREAILYFTAAGPDELLPITPEIAQRLDIDTMVFDGDDIHRPEDRPTPRRIMRQVTEYLGIGAQCSEIFGVDSEWLNEQGGNRLTLGHDLFGPEIFVDLVVEFTAVQKNRISTVGLRPWCTEAERNLRLDNLPTGVTGPGFDCSKATTPTERAICDTPDLWTTDRTMGTLFGIFQEKASPEEKRILSERQRGWIGRRDGCGADAACISDRYKAWFLDITSLTADLN